jgi:hypothetical protein
LANQLLGISTSVFEQTIKKEYRSSCQLTAGLVRTGGIAGAKAGIIGNFDACKLLVWGIETV